jgi:hypothetical protein
VGRFRTCCGQVEEVEWIIETEIRTSAEPNFRIGNLWRRVVGCVGAGQDFRVPL